MDGHHSNQEICLGYYSLSTFDQFADNHHELNETSDISEASTLQSPMEFKSLHGSGSLGSED